MVAMSIDVWEVTRRLREATVAAGGVVKWAAENKITQSIVSDVLNSRREPTPQVLKALGLRAIKGYEPDA
jgi:hypothetical protein